MFALKRNQIIVTALVVMVAVSFLAMEALLTETTRLAVTS